MTTLGWIARALLWYFAVPASAPPPEILHFPTHLASSSAAKPVELSAELYMPAGTYMPAGAGKPIAAMVILVSSGGVQDFRERWYARMLAREGIAGLVVDSFGPRGVRSTVADQTLVTAWQVQNDGFAALEALRLDARIDPRRIGVMGVSKGGAAALGSALVMERPWRRTGDLAFALHVPIAPGCGLVPRDARTVGAPMLFQMGVLDDYAPAANCTPVIAALKAAGTPVEVKIYDGAHHAWESEGAPRLLTKAENFSRCTGIAEPDGRITPAGQRPMRVADYDRWARANCMYVGNTHAGGGTPELKARTAADLIDFLHRNGF